MAAPAKRMRISLTSEPIKEDIVVASSMWSKGEARGVLALCREQAACTNPHGAPYNFLILAGSYSSSHTYPHFSMQCYSHFPTEREAPAVPVSVLDARWPQLRGFLEAVHSLDAAVARSGSEAAAAAIRSAAAA
jgi:hypothetical protein